MPVYTDEEWEEEWGLSSGLPLDDVDVTITAFTFGFNTQISATAICANITFHVDSTGQSQDQSFSVGDNWEIQGRGESIMREPGKTGKLSEQSNYGRLVYSAVRVAGPENMPRGGYKVAAPWVGTRWHLGSEKVITTNPQTNVEKERNALVFTKYLGKADGTAPVATSGTAAKTTAPASTSAPLNGDIDPALFARLVDLAKTFDTHDDFMDAALEWPEVAGIKSVERIVMSATRDGSVWKAKLDA